MMVATLSIDTGVTKMKILWINDYASFKGGAESYVHDVSSGLGDQYEHHLLYNFKNKLDLKFTENFKSAFPIVDLETQLQSTKPDLIYIHNIEDEEIQKVVNESGIKSFRFIHDHKLFCPREHKYTFLGNRTCEDKYGANCLGCCLFYNKQKNKIVTPNKLNQINHEVKLNTRIIVASNYMKEQLLSYGYDESKVSKINLFSRFSKANPNLVKDIDFLFVGGMVRGKGFDLFMESLEEINFKAVVRIISKDRRDILVSNLNISLEVIHDSSRDEVADFIGRSKVVVVPSISPETFSLVTAEALSLGTFVLASDVGAIGEFLGRGGIKLFKPGSVRDLRGKMESIIKDETYKDIKPVLFEKVKHLKKMNELIEEGL
jgi:glycosyltransferase involved in cell wall biosynthesis